MSVVSIGIIFGQDSDHIYSINTIIDQVYLSMELICSFYEGINISSYNCMNKIILNNPKSLQLKIPFRLHRVNLTLYGLSPSSDMP